jgi:hypothetical protein
VQRWLEWQYAHAHGGAATTAQEAVDGDADESEQAG